MRKTISVDYHLGESCFLSQDAGEHSVELQCVTALYRQPVVVSTKTSNECARVCREDCAWSCLELRQDKPSAISVRNGCRQTEGLNMTWSSNLNFSRAAG